MLYRRVGGIDRWASVFYYLEWVAWVTERLERQGVKAMITGVLFFDAN